MYACHLSRRLLGLEGEQEYGTLHANKPPVLESEAEESNYYVVEQKGSVTRGEALSIVHKQCVNDHNPTRPTIFDFHDTFPL
ncbi:hypothetical protein T265_00198 [Opisthorchis viverrini]|uniref:Uncharacterized protein n=1 Tax=Opisthorchis viverrini TaxID=6198 RepID=A0A075A3Q0_OPIVI|nr:hypothetical protein T265_00198 [Opisthorchis viverrini]KER34001.1 hypothetical protein T265_00198 [Opisthorchis viverrini]